MSKKYSFRRIDKSFKYAFDGFKNAYKEEKNMKIHTTVAVLVILAGFIFKIKMSEWIILVFAIGLVIGAELLNTAIENLVDLATQEYKLKAKVAKDTAAAYVLVLSITTAVIGLIIFVPKIIELIRS